MKTIIAGRSGFRPLSGFGRLVSRTVSRPPAGMFVAV